MDSRQRFTAWLEHPLIDSETKDELRRIAHDPTEVEDRFFKLLEFGTGGLRGKIGAGMNRMNVYTVSLATQALADVLKRQGQAHAGVAIAYDSRHMSREFAETAAGVLVGNGIPVYVFKELAPTPLLSFAVRYYKAGAGLVITASHNPPEYNGYKVYDYKGNQLLTDGALAVSRQMSELSLEDVNTARDAQTSSLWTDLGEEVIQEYYKAVAQIAPFSGADSDLRILYTPLHGTGGRFVPDVLHNAGFKYVKTVEEQMVPDSSFPTVRFPNPEEAASFKLAFRYGEKESFDIILATDPDADRVGTAVWDDGEWVLLNGNQVGVLLADYILQRLPDSIRKKAVVIKTIVTSEMIEPIAEKYGVEVMNTLTGFKYIGALIDVLEAQGKQFVLGFEESYGYLAGTAVRDKDAVLASLLIAQVAAFYKEQGLTLVRRLDQLMQEHGYYLEGLRSYSFGSSMEAQRAKEFIAELRTTPIATIADERVVSVLDYGKSTRLDLDTGKTSTIHLPAEDVLQWITAQNSRVTLRPSGTEPKMKLYYGVRADTREEAEKRLKDIEQAFDAMVRRGLKG
ncbi:MAG: phospho-sugar mutase [Firmicutes bacterium]|nr:phospho-sugar mutase [Bacillota bacterium]